MQNSNIDHDTENSNSTIINKDEENSVSSLPMDLSLMSILTNQFISEACNIPKRLFCPFCLFDFGFDFVLKSHIRDLHLEEIKNFSLTKLDLFTFDPCCFCHAKFYVRGLLSKHIIRKHEECILGLISEAHTNNDVYCKFCSYKVSVKQLKLLFIHLENRHSEVFINTLSKFQANINNTNPFYNNTTLIKDNILSEELCQLNITEQFQGNEKNLKPILKRGSLFSNISNTSEISKSNEVWIPKTRRKLRFDLTDLSVLSSSSNKENTEEEKTNFFNLKFNKFKKSEKSKFIGISNKIEPNVVKPRAALTDITSSAIDSKCNITPSEDSIDSLELMPFKCGICLKQFYDNVDLVYHVKRIHKKINFQAKYRCGLCKAKFYRNSYLVRHSKAHTTPKCLTAFEYKPL